MTPQPVNETAPINPYCSMMRVQLRHLTLTLKPTFAALAHIEAELNTNIVPLAQRMAKADVGVRDMMAIFFHGAQAAGHREVTREQLSAALLEDGMENAVKSAVQFLLLAINGAAHTAQATE